MEIPFKEFLSVLTVWGFFMVLWDIWSNLARKERKVKAMDYDPVDELQDAAVLLVIALVSPFVLALLWWIFK